VGKADSNQKLEAGGVRGLDFSRRIIIEEDYLNTER
jgi:hypothetical protein